MSESEEENNRGKASFDDKKKSKACRHFAYGLIEKAVENGWEDHETANLIILIAAQMDFNPARLIKCLEKTSTGTPEIIAVLIDNGHEFSALQLISMFLNKAQNIHKYFSLIGAALECQLFDFNNQETLEALIGVVQQQDYNMSDSERYARLLCEHCKSKRKVAKILSLFTTKSHFSLEESASFIHDIVTYDFFFDIPGDIESFYKNLRPANLKERLLILLSASKHLNSKNEIVESDADSEGNLMDFVVGEDDVSMASGSDLGSNESAEEDLLSESDGDGEKSSGKKNKKSKKNLKQAKETKKSKSSGGNSSKGSSKSITSSSGKRKGRIESSDDEDDGEVSSGDEADTLRSKASGGSKASGNSKDGGSSTVAAKKRKLIIEDDDDDDEEEQEHDSGAAEAKTAVFKTAVSKSATKDTAKTTVVAVSKNVSVTSNATSNKKSKLAVQSSSSSGSDDSDSDGSSGSSDGSLSSGAKRNQNYIASGANSAGSGGVGKQKNKPYANKNNNLRAADTVKLYPSDNSTINGSSSGSDESDSESGSGSGSEGELRHFDDEAIEGEESSDGDSDGEGRRVSKNSSKSSGSGSSSGSSRSSRHMNMNIDDSESEDDSDDIEEDRVEDEY